MTKKRIATMATCIALVGAVAVGGTLALLTAPSNDVNNTFAVGEGFTDPDTALVLNESPVTQLANGDYVSAAGSRVESNNYDQLVAGGTLYKDPKFDLTEGPTSWIVAYIDSVDPKLSGTLGNGWIKVTGADTYTTDKEDKTITGDTYYIYNTTVTADTDIPALFTQLTVGADATGNLTAMNIKGCAVQAVGDYQTVDTAVDTVVKAAVGAMNAAE